MWPCVFDRRIGWVLIGWEHQLVQVQSKPPILSHSKPTFSKIKCPRYFLLVFPFFPFPSSEIFLFFSLSRFPSWDFSLVYFPLPFPFLKLILFSFSLFQISHFPFKYKGFLDFSFLLFKILSLSKAG